MKKKIKFCQCLFSTKKKDCFSYFYSLHGPCWFTFKETFKDFESLKIRKKDCVKPSAVHLSHDRKTMGFICQLDN